MKVPFVFVHGAGCTSAVWKHQLEASSLGAHPGGLVAFTLPGREGPGSGGHSTLKPAGQVPAVTSSPGIDARAEAVAEALRERGVDRAVVVGHSMGGAVALSLALGPHASLVAGLALVSTGARLRTAPLILELARDDPAGLLDLMPQYVFSRRWRRTHPDEVAEVLDVMRGVPPETTLDDFASCDAFDVMDRLGDVDAPVLVACGERDQLTPPKYARYLADELPRARSPVLVPGAGHFLMVEAPGPLNEALARFGKETHQ
ncbi:MAG: alpha/beta hydrolase [Promethearchaeota archaeon]